MFNLKFLISLLFISGVLDAMMVHPRSLPRPREPDLPPPQHGGHALNWENVHDRAGPGKMRQWCDDAVSPFIE